MLSISLNCWLHYLILVVLALLLLALLVSARGSFFLWRALQCHSVLGDVAQKKKGKRTHKLSNSNHTVCEDLSFLRLPNIPQGKMVYVQWQ